jgi:hypothetical protein
MASEFGLLVRVVAPGAWPVGAALETVPAANARSRAVAVPVKCLVIAPAFYPGLWGEVFFLYSLIRNP